MNFVRQPNPVPIAEKPVPINRASKLIELNLSKATILARENVKYSQSIYIIPIKIIAPIFVNGLKSSFPIIAEIIKLVMGRIPQNTKMEKTAASVAPLKIQKNKMQATHIII